MSRFQIVSLVLVGSLLGNIGSWVIAEANEPSSVTLRVCFKQKGGGSLYFPADGAACKRGFTERSWNVEGPAGPAGTPGPAGPEGPPGPAGQDGTSVRILGSVASESELPPSGEPGDSYLLEGDLYVWSATASSWNNVGEIQGPRGEPGPEGPASLPAAYTAIGGATSITSGSWMTVLALEDLPAGTYFVSASGEIALTGTFPSSINSTIDGDCKVTGGDVPNPYISIQYYRRISTSSQPTSGSWTIHQPIALSGILVESDSPGTFYVQCLRRAGTLRVERVRLTAIPVASP